VHGPGHPLALGRDARARLGGAVRALLDAEGLEGALDTVRLAVILLASRTPSETGEVVIRTGELGRWIGLSKSRTASSVVPGLRRSGMVEVETEPGEFGQDDALRCRVLPMWKAHGMVGHPLHLKKSELATLLRLMEAVMAPGWRRRDGRVTPAGLIADRTGRGAATDRLALLLLVLEARETGRVRQCGGAVDTKRGRAAATVARLLGCTASAAERVLERLEGRDLVRRVRVRTASGLAHRSRLVVPAVAAAHGRTVVGDVHENRTEALCPVFSDPDVTAGPGQAPETVTEPQVSVMSVTDQADFAEPDVAAALHTDHPSLVAPVSPHPDSRGFSGEGRGGEGRRPERACAREDQAADGKTTAASATSPVAEGDPLRGERPKESPVEGCDEQHAAGAGAGAGAGDQLQAVGWDKAQRQWRVGLPADLRLRVALAPVAGLWEQLSGWQQDQVAAAAKTELGRLAGLLMQPEAAPRVLAGRLTDRLVETGGEALVATPYGWLIRRGLVQRQACSDRRCDDGIRVDTGGECENCNNVIHLRRARRAKIAAEVDRELPGLSDRERRRVLEGRLREQAAIEAAKLARRRERAAAEQARRDAARAAAQERAERERAAAAAAEAARQALPCQICGRARAAGLCELCNHRRQTETLIGEAALLEATWSADLTDPASVAAVTAKVRAAITQSIATAWQEFLQITDVAALEADPKAAEDAYAFAAFQTAQQAVQEYQDHALAMLGRTEEAESEARRAYQAEQSRPWFQPNPTGANAVATATQKAEAARERTAEYLLAARLEQLREQAAAQTVQAAAAPWRDRLPEFAARLLDGEAARAVTA
jgi:DNA-binding MarR family transcriptional regulator